MNRKQITKEAVKKDSPFRSMKPSPWTDGPRFGGPKKGRPAPKTKAKLAPDKGTRQYLSGINGPQKTAAGRRAKMKVRAGRFRDEKPIASPTEDSLSPKFSDKLAKSGWDYSNGVWRPPTRRGTLA